MEGSEFDKRRIVFLTQALEEKKLEIQMAGYLKPEAPTRAIASVDPEASVALKKMKHKDSDLSDFYFLRIADLKREKKYKEALVMVEKIKNSTADEEHLAHADYEYIAIQCAQLRLSEACIDTLDQMVLQYPESKWTGHGLIWLSKTYINLNRKDDAKKIEAILKSDFAGLKVE
jgi:tetratricopeptide (TPR) repeat protein